MLLQSGFFLLLLVGTHYPMYISTFDLYTLDAKKSEKIGTINVMMERRAMGCCGIKAVRTFFCRF
jgi:hypothetical protein